MHYAQGSTHCPPGARWGTLTAQLLWRNRHLDEAAMASNVQVAWMHGDLVSRINTERFRGTASSQLPNRTALGSVPVEHRKRLLQ